MLVPMGIVNEYHEPTTFNGVERPSLDNKIVPTTWREMGIGVSGRINSASIRYQAYLMNGFLSYGESHKLRGSDGLRKGRQKGLNLLEQMRILLVELNIMACQSSSSGFHITQGIPKQQLLKSATHKSVCQWLVWITAT